MLKAVGSTPDHVETFAANLAHDFKYSLVNVIIEISSLNWSLYFVLHHCLSYGIFTFQQYFGVRSSPSSLNEKLMDRTPTFVSKEKSAFLKLKSKVASLKSVTIKQHQFNIQVLICYLLHRAYMYTWSCITCTISSVLQ